MRRFVLALLVATVSIPAAGQTIVQSRGVDSRVDYASLTAFGPWDDRNYDLTAEDLELLAPNEEEQKVMVPAFFRVELRRLVPEMLREGPVQYPRSSLPRFLVEHGGYLVDGRLYRNASRVDGAYEIDFDGDEGIDEKEWVATRALEGEVRVTNPTGAAESAIAINPVDPDLVIAGSNGPGSGQKMHYSTDGGESWTQAAALPLGGTCCDPTVAWSSDGTKGYTATLGSSVFFYRTGDGGQTWTDLDQEPGADPRRELGGGVDKEFVHVDVHPTSPHLDNVYVTWHQGNVMQFARSTDLGHTWATQSHAADPRGIGSDITTDAAGNVYHFYPAFSPRTIEMKKSTDGGVTFTAAAPIANTNASFIFPIPSMETREVFIYVSADTDRTSGPHAGSVYAAWTDSTAATSGNPATNHAQIVVAYSRDGGTTWSFSTPHETDDLTTVDRWHQWLGVGPDGTVWVGFYDTRDGDRTSVDFYYSKSTDGAQTWSEPERLTTVTSPNITSGFEFGDYNGLDVVMGQVITIFTDNRNEGGGGGNSVDIYSAGFSTGPIFTDGFESGDTSAWSSTSP